MNVGQVMTRDVRACGQDESANRAAQLMWENDCGCVPIVDGEGKAIGMITDRDICMAAYTQGKALWEIPVATAASHDLIVVHEDDPIDTAEGLMQKHQLRRLAVVDAGGHPVGILSMNDLARRVQSGSRHRDLSADAVTRTLAAICTHGPHAVAAE